MSRRRAERSGGRLGSRLPFEELSVEWPLDLEQQRLAACETLLLCIPLESVSQVERQSLSRMLTSLLGPNGPSLDSLAQGIANEGVGEHVRPYLHYRLLLLLQKQPHAFKSADAFVSWATRQLAVFCSALMGVVRSTRHARPRTPPVALHSDPGRPSGDVSLTVALRTCMQQLRGVLSRYEAIAAIAQASRKRLSNGLDEQPQTESEAEPSGELLSPVNSLDNGPVDGTSSTSSFAGPPLSTSADAAASDASGARDAEFRAGISSPGPAAIASLADCTSNAVSAADGELVAWLDEYNASLRYLQELTWTAYAQLDGEAARATFEHRLPLSFPINLRHYGTLLLSTFDAEQGTPLTQTEEAIALLRRPRAALFPRDAAAIHLVCLAEATFVTHLMWPNGIELIEAVKNRIKDATAALEKAIITATAPALQLLATPSPLAVPYGGCASLPLREAAPAMNAPSAAANPGAAIPAAHGAAVPTRTVARAASAELRGCLNVLEAMRSHFGHVLSSLHRHFPGGKLRKVLENTLDAHVMLFTMHSNLAALRERQRALVVSHRQPHQLQQPAAASTCSCCNSPAILANVTSQCGAAPNAVVPSQADESKDDSSQRNGPPPSPLIAPTRESQSGTHASPVSTSPDASPCPCSLSISASTSAPHSTGQSVTESPRLASAAVPAPRQLLPMSAATRVGTASSEQPNTLQGEAQDVVYEARRSDVKPLVVSTRSASNGIPATSTPVPNAAADPADSTRAAPLFALNASGAGSFTPPGFVTPVASLTPVALSDTSGTTPPLSPRALSIDAGGTARRPFSEGDTLVGPQTAPSISSTIPEDSVLTSGSNPPPSAPASGIAAFLSKLGIARGERSDRGRGGERRLEGLALRAVNLYARSPADRSHAGGGSEGQLWPTPVSVSLSGVSDREAAAELQREMQRLYLVSIWHAFVDLCIQTSSLRPAAGILSCTASADFSSFEGLGSLGDRALSRTSGVRTSEAITSGVTSSVNPKRANGVFEVAPVRTPSNSSPSSGDQTLVGADVTRGAYDRIINVAQMTQIVMRMSPLLIAERDCFVPVFAPYRLDIGEEALLEWGRLFLEQLRVTLRAHAAAADTADEKEKALLSFTDLWSAMRRLITFGEGKIWASVPLYAALSPLEPLVAVWVARDKELVLDHTLDEIAAEVASSGWQRSVGALRDDVWGQAPLFPTVKRLFKALKGKDDEKGGWNPLYFRLPPRLAYVSLPPLVSQLASALLSYCSLVTSGLPAGVPETAVPTESPLISGAGWVGRQHDNVVAEASRLRMRLQRQRDALDALRTYTPKEAVRNRSGYWGSFVVSLGLDSAAQRRCSALLDELNSQSLHSLCARAASAAAVLDELNGPDGLLTLLDTAAKYAEWDQVSPKAAFSDVNDLYLEARNHIYEYIGVKVSPDYCDPLRGVGAAVLAHEYWCRVIFGELRDDILLNLYVPTPSQNRIAGALRLLDSKLGELHYLLPDEVYRRQVLLHIFRSFCTALEVVLLDPLPLRDFAADDASLFIKDFIVVQEFFMARNENNEPQGLMEYDIQSYSGTGRLLELLRMMALSSEEVVHLHSEHQQLGHDHLVELSAKLLAKRTDEVARRWVASKP